MENILEYESTMKNEKFVDSEFLEKKIENDEN